VRAAVLIVPAVAVAAGVMTSAAASDSSVTSTVAQQAVTPADQFLGVSCPADRFCMGVGWYIPADGVKRPLAETWDGSAWHITFPLAPSPAPASVLQTVSCTSRTACLAVGGVLTLLDGVMAGRLRNGFALVRPPGHHAEPERAMGFCLFNNVAIGAAYLRARYHLERILVVDWDVHHGNGTQHAFARDPGVLYVSTHRYPFYPGTGALDEVGDADGAGYTVNIPFPGGVGDAEYLEAFHTVIEPIALQYAPQLVLISAGFDPHRRDPLGGMRVTEAGFAAMARSLIDVAERVAAGRCVAVLEGGYDLNAIRNSAAVVLDELSGAGGPLPPPPAPSCARPILDAVRAAQRHFWKFV